MMFQADAAFALELIALGIGFWILIKASSDEIGNLKGFGKFIGYFIIVSAFLVFLCTAYYTLRYWEEGHFSKPNVDQIEVMHAGGMMMSQMHGGSHDMMMGKMGMHSEKCSMMMDQEKCCPKKCDHKMKGEMKQCPMGGMMEKSDEMMKDEQQGMHHPEGMDK